MLSTALHLAPYSSLADAILFSPPPPVPSRECVEMLWYQKAETEANPSFHGYILGGHILNSNCLWWEMLPPRSELIGDLQCGSDAGASAEQIDTIPTVLVGGPGGEVEKDCRYLLCAHRHDCRPKVLCVSLT